jgi:uncharacterized protein
VGRPVHFEIHASDPDALIAFYSGLFGWEFSRWGSEPYWLAGTGETNPGINGAIVARTGEPPAGAQPVNAFVVTAEVPDLDEALAQLDSLGGTVVVPRREIPGVGSIAYVHDPDGNIVGVLQPAADGDGDGPTD